MRITYIFIFILLLLTPFCSDASAQYPVERETPGVDTIWVEDSSGCNNDIITVNVWISNPNTEVDAFLIDMTYCTDMLAYIDCQPGDVDPGWTSFDCTEPSSGTVRMGAYGSTAIPTGSRGVLVKLRFQVNCASCNENDTCLMQIVNLQDDVAGFQAIDGTFTYSCPATATPTPSPSETPSPQNTPSPTPTSTPTPVQTPSDRIWVEDCNGCNGQQIQVVVMLNNGITEVDSFTFDLYFDSTALEYVSCEAGELNPGWVMMDCNNASAGRVVSGGFATSGNGIPAGNYGTFVLVTFNVICSTCSSGDTSPLVVGNLQDDLSGFTAESGLFTYACQTTPTPTQTPTDTATPIPTDTPTNTPTQTPTFTPTNTPTPIPTNTPTQTPTDTPTPVPSDTPTQTPTQTPTDTPTQTPTNTPTQTPTNTPTQTPTDTPTQTPTNTPTPVPTNTPTQTPTNTPTQTPTQTPTNTPTSTPTQTPTDTPTQTPSNTPTPIPTDAPTQTPTNTPTSTPTQTPTQTPSNTPTAIPTDTPTPLPTSTPTSIPCLHHGDVNFDQIITSSDSQAAFRITLGLIEPTEQEFCEADCNGDEIVTSGDSQTIFRAVLGLDQCADPL